MRSAPWRTSQKAPSTVSAGSSASAHLSSSAPLPVADVGSRWVRGERRLDSRLDWPVEPDVNVYPSAKSAAEPPPVPASSASLWSDKRRRVSRSLHSRVSATRQRKATRAPVGAPVPPISHSGWSFGVGPVARATTGSARRPTAAPSRSAVTWSSCVDSAAAAASCSNANESGHDVQCSSGTATPAPVSRDWSAHRSSSVSRGRGLTNARSSHGGGGASGRLRTFIFVIETRSVTRGPSSSAKRRPDGGRGSVGGVDGPRSCSAARRSRRRRSSRRSQSTAARRTPSAAARRDISDITGCEHFHL